MAKTSMIEREKRRTKTAAKFAAKRTELKKRAMDPKLSEDERLDARRKFQALPRDASPARQRNRCNVTGRPRGYYRRFGLSRNQLREAVMRGDVPGVKMSSW